MVPNCDRILVVENDTGRGQEIARELQQLGVEVLAASDPMNALILGRKYQPSAVVIHSQLAGGGGLIALKRIRCNAFTTNLPVIIATADGAEAREFLAAGAQECIASPWSAEDLLAAARRNVLQPLDFTTAPLEALAQPDRLAALRETALLDSPPEESFDRLTRLASRLLGAGTALVSLVDQDRQFFKSQVGLAQPWAGARQTRLSHSFCQWVVAGKEQLVVDDANAHPTLRTNLAVKDLGVIAYAGVPLSGRGGHVLGSFCAIDAKPRAWADEDLETLRDLAQVSEAYAALEQAKRRAGDPGSGPDNLEISIHVAGKAVRGAARVLRRYGAHLGEAERSDLLGIIEEQGEHLVALVPHMH